MTLKPDPKERPFSQICDEQEAAIRKAKRLNEIYTIILNTPKEDHTELMKEVEKL